MPSTWARVPAATSRRSWSRWSSDSSGVSACAAPAASAAIVTAPATASLKRTFAPPVEPSPGMPLPAAARCNSGRHAARRGGAVDLLVAAHDGRDAEAVLAGAAAVRRLDLAQALDRPRHRVLVVDHEAGAPMLDDLRRRALGERDHRRAAGERLDHHEPERLGPADRHEQRAGALEQVALALGVGLADVLDPVAAELRLDLLGEERLLARLHGPGEHERRAGLAGSGESSCACEIATIRAFLPCCA